MKATTRSSLHWGLKQSLLDYVESSEGRARCGSGATRNGNGFCFPCTQSGTGKEPLAPARFDGSVSLEAYGGMLSFTIASPAVEAGHHGFVLSVDSPAETGRRITLAQLQDVVLTGGANGGMRRATATPVLTLQGAEFFDGFYSTGTALDQLSIEERLVTP